MVHPRPSQDGRRYACCLGSGHVPRCAVRSSTPFQGELLLAAPCMSRSTAPPSVIDSGDLRASALDRGDRPRPLGAIVLVASGAALLVLYGILAIEAAEAVSLLTRQSGLHFTCVGTCSPTQGAAALGAGFLLAVTAWWMYRKPQYHVAEGLLACIVGVVSGLVVGGIGGGPLLPIAASVVGGIWASIWTPTPRASRVRVPR